MRAEWKTGPSLDAVEREIRSRILQERSNLPEMILTQVQAGGKRVRPTLALRGVEVFGGEITDRAIRAAASVEMVHVGSLIHDDIMDLALTRRGVPTINATDGMSHALVAGDLILGIAGECAISVSAEVGGAIARALVDLSVGQQLETESLFDAKRTEDAYYRSVRGKTGSLLAVAASIGAMAEDVDAEAVQALAAYGMEFGLAFQILDDLLDVVSTEELFSKPVHNDFRVGVVNYPTMLAWAEGDFVDFQPLFEDRHASDRDRCEGSDRLVRELFTSPYVHRAEDTARGHAAAARDALLALGSTHRRWPSSPPTRCATSRSSWPAWTCAPGPDRPMPAHHRNGDDDSSVGTDAVRPPRLPARPAHPPTLRRRRHHRAPRRRRPRRRPDHRPPGDSAIPVSVRPAAG